MAASHAKPAWLFVQKWRAAALHQVIPSYLRGGARHPKAPQKPNRCLISCSEVELIALHREGTTAGSCLSWRPHTHDPLEVISLIPEPPHPPFPSP